LPARHFDAHVYVTNTTKVETVVAAIAGAAGAPYTDVTCYGYPLLRPNPASRAHDYFGSVGHLQLAEDVGVVLVNKPITHPNK
jgi:hypothetical protein